jgi:uncharacterized protein DUF5682
VIADPVLAIDQLASSRTPYLIGIRHHSPMLSCAVPALLDAAAPDFMLLELPADLQDWLPWLAAEEARAPLALAASRKDGRGMVFYPYADFSPELAAIRWARGHDVRVEAFDLPVGLATDDTPRHRTRLAPEGAAPLTDALGRSIQSTGADELWDRLVEVRSAGADPEVIRRAALSVGWSLRFEHERWGEVSAGDLRREMWMRERLHAALASGAQKTVALVGAFHASALLRPVEPGRKWPKPSEVVTSLVPYTFELLDSRTGYPAGIRDPEWQQAVWRSEGSPGAIIHSVSGASVRICRELRRLGHAAGVPDAREVVRVTSDLANLRDLPAPGRRELVEGLQTALAQAEPTGRGRAVAAAMQRVLVGTRRGKLAPGTPRSGLGPHVEQLLAELRLPGADAPYPREVRLDPLRSDLDRRRHIAIQRLRTCEVPYAVPISVDANLVTGLWMLSWRPATAAAIELASARGMTLSRAAEGTLRMRLARAEVGSTLTAHLRLETLRAAAECALVDLAIERIEDAEHSLPHDATLAQLVDALELCEQLARGHVPGLPATTLPGQLLGQVTRALLDAAVAAIEGLSGSNSLDDARAVLAVAQQTDALRLRFALEQLERNGSPLMQGTAGAVRVLVGHLAPEALGERMASWLDYADQSVLARRLSGALAIAAPLLEAAPSSLHPLIRRVVGLDDPDFLQRLPALREAFEILSPAARQRFLDALRPALSADFDLRVDAPVAALARWAEADQHGRSAVLAQFPQALSV